MVIQIWEIEEEEILGFWFDSDLACVVYVDEYMVMMRKKNVEKNNGDVEIEENMKVEKNGS
jgi:hypothetical protein